MEHIACLYFEGNDSKITLFGYNGGQLTLLRAESIDTSMVFAEQESAAVNKGGSGSAQEPFGLSFIADEASALNKVLLPRLNQFFRGVDFAKCKFIPILTEPALYFHKISDKKDFALAHAKGNGKETTVADFVSLDGGSTLAVYPSGKGGYLQLLDALAVINGRRVLRIPTIKSAEISLAAHICRKAKLDNDGISLILYVGKEYSKLIFLRGNALLHVGSTLSVGKNSFDSHGVLARKILLEMEQLSLVNINSIIICGEDNSDDLVSVISEAYPRSKVLLQHVEPADVKATVSNRDPFIVPVAVAREFVGEIERKVRGINLLPQYLKEEQKVIQLGVAGYVMIGLIFLSTILFSMRISSHAGLIQLKEQEIARIKVILEQKNETLNKIKKYEARIFNVDQTKAVLTQLAVGTGMLSAQIKKVATFADRAGDLWINQIAMDQSKQFKVGGYTFSRGSVIELADSYDNSVLQHITFEPLRNSRTFKFSIEPGGGANSEKKK